MRFYNPFKWHIFMTFDNKYYVRKRGIFFNYYIDLDDGYIWSSATEGWMKYCTGTYDQAKNALSNVTCSNFVE